MAFRYLGGELGENNNLDNFIIINISNKIIVNMDNKMVAVVAI